jgi:hypothetical protein
MLSKRSESQIKLEEIGAMRLKDTAHDSGTTYRHGSIGVITLLITHDPFLCLPNQ